MHTATEDGLTNRLTLSPAGAGHIEQPCQGIHGQLSRTFCGVLGYSTHDLDDIALDHVKSIEVKLLTYIVER